MISTTLYSSKHLLCNAFRNTYVFSALFATHLRWQDRNGSCHIYSCAHFYTSSNLQGTRREEAIVWAARICSSMVHHISFPPYRASWYLLSQQLCKNHDSNLHSYLLCGSQYKRGEARLQTNNIALFSTKHFCLRIHDRSKQFKSKLQKVLCAGCTLDFIGLIISRNVILILSFDASMGSF